MTHQDRLTQIATDLMGADTPPQVIRQHLVVLTALWGDYRTAATRADLAYRHVRGACRQTHATAKDAEFAAESTEEYRAFREAKDQESYVLELIRSCKAALRSLDEEVRLAR